MADITQVDVSLKGAKKGIIVMVFFFALLAIAKPLGDMLGGRVLGLGTKAAKAASGAAQTAVHPLLE